LRGAAYCTNQGRLSLRPGLEILRKRAEELIQALLAAGIDVPIHRKEDKDRLDKILESAGLERLSTPEPAFAGGVSADLGSAQYIATVNVIGAPLTPSLSTHFPPEGLGALHDIDENDSAFLNDWSPNAMNADISPEWPWMELFATEMASSNPLGGRQSGLDLNLSGVDGADQAADDPQNEDIPSQEMANQLSARFGSLHLMQDGVLRFFGTPATTHLTMGAQYLHSAPRPNALSLDRRSLLHNAGLDLDIEPSFENRLVDLFFARHNKCRTLVDEADFQRLRALAGQSNGNEERDARSTRVLTSTM
jgi:hypothetical protein